MSSGKITGYIEGTVVVNNVSYDYFTSYEGRLRVTPKYRTWSDGFTYQTDDEEKCSVEYISSEVYESESFNLIPFKDYPDELTKVLFDLCQKDIDAENYEIEWLEEDMEED